MRLVHRVVYILERACYWGRTRAMGVPLSEYLDISFMRGILAVF